MLRLRNKKKKSNIHTYQEARPRGYKFFPCSTQLSTKFILLINVKMPTIVGILTFIRAGEGISEPLSDILYNMLTDEIFKHPATQIESLVLSHR